MTDPTDPFPKGSQRFSCVHQPAGVSLVLDRSLCSLPDLLRGKHRVGCIARLLVRFLFVLPVREFVSVRSAF